MTTFLPNRTSIAGPLCALLCIALLAIPLQTRAQTLRTALPEDAVETGVLGEPQLVEADVGEGTPLARIELRYRFDGGAYATVPMRPTNEPGIFAVEVPTRGVRAERMEFYIVAEDTAGGQLLKGSESVPLSRELASPSSPSPGDDVPAEPSMGTTPPSEGEPTPSSGRRKYLYYALGVLAVGAIAAAASADDGGSSDGDGCGAERCDLPLVFPPGR